MQPTVTIIGGGFAGTEAAWAAANLGSRVLLYEMRPHRSTPVHRTGDLAELVCSNSFKSNRLTNASGVLKEEMRRLGSLVLAVAERYPVPAGEALAVDRQPFARAITDAVTNHPNITLIREEMTALPSDRPLIVATGPLTSDALAAALKPLIGDALHFYDAVAPTITQDSLDMSRIFRASRFNKTADPDRAATADGDYLNCPMSKEEYERFYHELLNAEKAELHEFEREDKTIYFEMCLPIEELAARGPKTCAYGPMKPIGLRDPITGRRPYAVVQLRPDNLEGTLWGMVGFQTRLKWGEQQRVFRLIPGLENAEFVRYGVMHRNTYICSPRLLDKGLMMKSQPGLFMAGQITGVEGYIESAATGLLAGINAHRWCKRLPPFIPPRETVLGSLLAYITETSPERFAPMNANFGLLPEPLEPARDKRERARQKSDRAINALERAIDAAKPTRVEIDSNH